MNETCVNHALNMTNICGCPYCRIDELERMLRMKQEDWISACNEAQVLEQQLVEAQSELTLSIKERIELGGKLSRYEGVVKDSELIKMVGDNYGQRLRDLYSCTTGAASGLCDGTKGTRMRCPELICWRPDACNYVL